MQSQTAPEDFPDLKAHKAMWSGYTSFLLRGVIGVLVVVLLTAWITGVI